MNEKTKIELLIYVENVVTYFILEKYYISFNKHKNIRLGKNAKIWMSNNNKKEIYFDYK